MRIFPTPQDAEAAFYEALERADIELMMAVWAEDEEILCVHPGGERLTGQDQVRDSWRQIFAGGAQARVHLTQQAAISGPMVAVHSVHENFPCRGKAPLQAVSPPTCTCAPRRAGA
jgi:ketosteroid isomerase-like protein